MISEWLLIALGVVGIVLTVVLVVVNIRGTGTYRRTQGYPASRKHR